ncbi:DUF397 domain-containing protein [Cryptosporangium arvum]|uniref:DUF397 domain-containing protein n=1 Tax=Cryptosporangium arvum DSM 44712 TaxID=927661 RepID=A0A010Z1I9_9ACTN|nr:protein of unknown function DUF397 [Cryptosporangium arvum DSM 44712]
MVEKLFFRKSTKSNVANCVEVAFSHRGTLLRNSRYPDGLVLELTRREWEDFRAAAASGRFDRPGCDEPQ